jgi:hypothetical protein
MRRYLEFALIIVVLGIVSLVMLHFLESARDDMEEASVQTMVQSIRTQMLESVAHRETAGGSLPSSDNPFDWVRTKPVNYLGVLEHEPEESSVWYYHAASRELIYRFRDGRTARFQLSRAARSSGLRGVMSGIGLVRLDAPRQ